MPDKDIVETQISEEATEKNEVAFNASETGADESEVEASKVVSDFL